ncbi:Hypothetical predicted protein, partial [Pelobates cultripes]
SNYERGSVEKEDTCHFKNNKMNEVPHYAPLNRRPRAKRDYSIKQEMEQQRLAEQRATYIYSKLHSARPTAIRGTQLVNISKFED